MNRLGAPVSAPSGVSIELSDHGKKVVLRAWSPYDTIPAVHVSIEDLAHTLRLQIPAKKAPRKPLTWRERITGRLRGEEAGA